MFEDVPVPDEYGPDETGFDTYEELLTNFDEELEELSTEEQELLQEEYDNVTHTHTDTPDITGV